ncbi:MAG: DUF86 domain-containing protein [Candidatus Aenigmatarchaeota archaeon]|nr:MAG: DUF86 domain-containing protein [Candidatus Aenigmarchaeota archaeon]
MNERINARLRILEESLKRLEKIKEMRKEDFLRDPLAPPAAERSFQVAIEVIIDLGNMLVSRLGLRSPETYSDIFRILGDAGILSQELVDEAIGMVRFRNLLVHAYVRVNPNIVYKLTKTKINVLRSLAKELVEHLESHE